MSKRSTEEGGEGTRRSDGRKKRLIDNVLEKVREAVDRVQVAGFLSPPSEISRGEFRDPSKFLDKKRRVPNPPDRQ